MTGAELVPLELAGRLALAFGLAVFLGLAFEEVYKREDRSSPGEKRTWNAKGLIFKALMRGNALLRALRQAIPRSSSSLSRSDAVASMRSPKMGRSWPTRRPSRFWPGAGGWSSLGATRPVMRHAGSATDSITGPISVAAG
jgi:hypothetical protein